MMMTEIIAKKREGLPLHDRELGFFVRGYTEGTIPDYQASALLMAIYLMGMNEDETVSLTLHIMRSGRVLDLAAIPGIKVDKHSTGGVGDKISLILGPLVASCGCVVPMISGRGLGHTGGTLDKLESIPGFTTDASLDDFVENVRANGFAVNGQTDDLAPADRKLYALRDVTATVASIPLIVASILSKKCASGADAFVFDVKTGRGAFMKDMAQALALGRMLVRVSAQMNKKSAAYITDMNRPLGRCIGNSLEVEESIRALRGDCSDDLRAITTVLSTEMLLFAGKIRSREEGPALLEKHIRSGSALETFRSVIQSQGGDPRVTEEPSILPRASRQVEVTSPTEGYVTDIDALKIALCVKRMGAGRERMDDPIRPGVGIRILKKTGDRISGKETVAVLHGDDDYDFARGGTEVLAAFSIDSRPAEKHSPIFHRIGPDDEEDFTTEVDR
jgi:pyrimidine-nucleoside phosphorylase